MTAREASSSILPPKLLHPSPTTVTSSPELPRRRIRITRAYSRDCTSDKRTRERSDPSGVFARTRALPVSLRNENSGAAWESNPPSDGLRHRTDFEDRLGHQA